MSGLAAALGLAALALGVRALSFASVFDGERVAFFDYDSYYHMRRALHALAHFPSVLAFDRYLNFPHGGQPIWPPLFDRLLAATLLPFYAAGQSERVVRVAVWIPPALGAAAVLVAYGIARRHLSGTAAWLGAGLLCLLPAHFAYSQLGYVDHHVAVGLVGALLLAAAMAFLARPDARLGAPDAGLALLPGTILLLWPGSLLEVVLAEGALMGWLVSVRDATRAATRARRLAGLHAVSLALVLPAGLTADWQLWSAWSPAVLSRFQPWLFAMLTLHAVACWLLWRHRPPLTATRRLTDALAVAAALLGASVLSFPGLRVGAEEAWRWLARDEAFQSSVLESLPLFFLTGAFDTAHAEFLLTRGLYLFPVAAVWLAWGARRREDAGSRLLLVAWSLSFAALTLAQQRFAHSLALPFALVLAAAAAEALRAAAPLLRTAPRRLAATAAGAALLAWMLTPSVSEYVFHLRNLRARAAGRPVTLTEHTARMRAATDAASWLRTHSPPTSGFLDPAREPEYGVLADFGYGHLITYVAQRPTVIGNFGDDVGTENLALVLRFIYAAPEEAYGILDQLRVRYVLLETLDAVPERFGEQAMLRRLAGPVPTPPSALRLLHETSGLPRPRFRIYEYAGTPEPGR